MVYAISYDLNKVGQNYEALYEAIKSASYNNTWMHYLESTWIIKSYLSAEKIYEIIKPVVDDNDSFIIMEITKNYFGWLPKEAWEYLSKMFD